MRYFIGYIVTIGLLIVLILFLVSSGGGKHKSGVPANKPLNSYAFTDAQVRLVADGPIVANELHLQSRITVGTFVVTFEKIQGYDGTVVDSQSFPNTENSYYAFLTALMQARFTTGAPVPGSPTDTGLCPLGTRYDIELIQNGQMLGHYWITSCGGAASFKGSLPLVRTLFHGQIPNYGRVAGNSPS